MKRFDSISSMTRHGTWAFRSFIALSIALTSACAVSQQSEVEMGASYAAQIEKELPLVHDAEILAYLKLLGDSLASVVDDRSLTWHFNIVNSKDLNAFAVPGGYIYLNRGIIERATNMSEVAGVLGHEIGHVTKRHSIKQMQKAQGANLGVAVGCALTDVCTSEAAQAGINIAATGIFAKFSRDDETEADEEGVKTLARAGIDPHGMPEMFQILLNERKARPDAVSAFFASHPMEESRIAFTNEAITKLPPSTRRLVKDTPAFQTFKRRVTALPVPPPPPAKKSP
jgi:predicted Zn-dependent protease